MSLTRIATKPAKLSAKGARLPAKGAKAPAKRGAKSAVSAIRTRIERPKRERIAKRRRNTGAAIAAAGAATGAGAYLANARRRERLLGRIKGLAGRSEPPKAAQAGSNGGVPEYAAATPGQTSASSTA